MTWTKKEVLPPLPEEAQKIIDDLQAVSGGVVDILKGLSLALEAAKVFFLLTNDLFAAIMTAIITAVEDLINDLFGSGVFQLVINPFTVTNTTLRREKVGEGADQFDVTFVTPDDAIKLAIKSFDDPYDIDPSSINSTNPQGNLKRPDFSDSATVAGFGLLFTAKDLNIYIQFLQALKAVWTTDDIEFALGRALEAQGTTPGRSTGADWDSKRLNSIGSLGSIQNQLLKILSLAKGYTLIPEGIINLIDALQRKADDLIETIEAFQAVIDDLTNLQGLAGVHVLDIPPQVGGNNLLKASLPNPILQGPDNFLYRYTFFIMYVGGGISSLDSQVTAVDTIRQLVAAFPAAVTDGLAPIIDEFNEI